MVCFVVLCVCVGCVGVCRGVWVCGCAGCFVSLYFVNFLVFCKGGATVYKALPCVASPPSNVFFVVF